MIQPRRALLLGALLTALAGVGCSPAGPAAELMIEDARVREPAPGTDKTAGYFTLHNHSGAAVVITGASSPDARAVEMHVTESEGGMTRMRRIRQLEVDAGETVRFEPGGRHLMLFGVGALDDGIEISLQRSDGAAVTARFRTLSLGGD